MNELEIENRSDRPLFIQEGDRLRGGKQDRTVHTSLVVPPRSGRMPIPTFCIEHDRWRPRTGQGGEFGATVNLALAQKSVRYAAKVDGDQGKVWHEVAREKKEMQDSLSAANATSSLNETIDSPEVTKVTEATTAALGSVLATHPDAVGVAIAVNGKLEEIDLYPGNSLLRKLYPRLLASYAIQGATQQAAAKGAKPVTSADVTKFLAEGEARSKREETVNAQNAAGIVDFDKKVACETRYEGKWVHRQIMSK